MKFYAMILLYNKRLENCITYNAIKNIDGLELLICDNSIEEMDNSSYCLNNNLEYLNFKSNLGISRAYNTAFDYIKNQTDYLFIFDDDSDISEEYINYFMLQANSNSNVDIFIPKVVSLDNNKICSPSIVKKLNGKKKIHAINSGIMLKKNLLTKYTYDEKFFLYFCDIQFFNDNQDKNIKYLENQVLYQNFSDHSSEYSESDIKQLQMRIDDAKIYFSVIKYHIFIGIFIFQQHSVKKRWIQNDLNINYWKRS